ncbi:unnamed protein product, partial [Nesidiocoris tenuis]
MKITIISSPRSDPIGFGSISITCHSRASTQLRFEFPCVRSNSRNWLTEMRPPRSSRLHVHGRFGRAARPARAEGIRCARPLRRGAAVGHMSVAFARHVAHCSNLDGISAVPAARADMFAPDDGSGYVTRSKPIRRLRDNESRGRKFYARRPTATRGQFGGEISGG